MVILDELMITMMLGDAAAADDYDDYDDPVNDYGADDNDNDDDDVNDGDVDDAVVRLLSQEEGEEFTDCLSYKPTPPGNIASRYLVVISCYLAYLVILHILLSFHLLIL